MSKIHFTATDAELDEFSVDKRPVQFEEKQDSRSDLWNEKNNEIKSSERGRNGKSKLILVLTIFSILFFASLLFLLVLIPISHNISDTYHMTSDIPLSDVYLVQLIETNSLWYWEISVETEYNVTLYLTDYISKYSYNRLITASDVPRSFYALTGSSIITATGDNINITVSTSSNVIICNSTPCYIAEGPDYYNINFSSAQPVIIQVVNINASYYRNLVSSDIIRCEASKGTGCVMELDNLEPYYLLAESSSVDVSADNLRIELIGRRSWYYLTVFLLIPGIVLMIVIACIICSYFCFCKK